MIMIATLLFSSTGMAQTLPPAKVAALSAILDFYLAGPTVAVTAPGSGAGYVGPATIALAAQVTDIDAPISKVDFFDGTTLIGTATGAPYTVNWNSVAAGTYSITAKATDTQGESTASAAISIMVKVNVPPSVSITAPTNNASYTGPAGVTLTANAADTDGTITKVDFFNGATLLGTTTAAPYTYNWAGVAAGNYTITAKATDSQGATTASSPIAINVNGLPTVNLTAPANNASYIAPATIALAATAADADGTIAKVDFFQGTTLLATVTTAPYAFNWSGAALGSYSITAVATDNQGAAVTSAPAAITLAANTPPTVAMTTPADNQGFIAPATINLNATAGDTDGSIAKVEFYQGATLLATTTQAPYSFPWTNVAPGSYTLFAKATDDFGAVTTSSAVNITVAANAVPSVTVGATPAAATAPATVSLSATASDTDGSIAKVEFFNGATLLATVTQAPYTYNWTNVAAGSHAVTARATDNGGATATSAPVTVAVSSDGAQVYFIDADHLNTPRLITNQTNQVVWQWDNNDPFGNNVPNADPGNTGTQMEFNLRFPGQYFDKETNLHYNYFRTYDPQQGRYIESDPIGLAGGINTYTYVDGNPVSYTDPLGLQRGPALLGLGGYTAAGQSVAPSSRALNSSTENRLQLLGANPALNHGIPMLGDYPGVNSPIGIPKMKVVCDICAGQGGDSHQCPANPPPAVDDQHQPAFRNSEPGKSTPCICLKSHLEFVS